MAFPRDGRRRVSDGVIVRGSCRPDAKWRLLQGVWQDQATALFRLQERGLLLEGVLEAALEGFAQERVQREAESDDAYCWVLARGGLLYSTNAVKR